MKSLLVSLPERTRARVSVSVQWAVSTPRFRALCIFFRRQQARQSPVDLSPRSLPFPHFSLTQCFFLSPILVPSSRCLSRLAHNRFQTSRGFVFLLRRSSRIYRVEMIFTPCRARQFLCPLPSSMSLFSSLRRRFLGERPLLLCSGFEKVFKPFANAYSVILF